MLRFIVYLAIAIGLVYFATSVQLGKHTLVGHIRAIWHTEEMNDLKEGVKEKATPTVDRLERGAKAGYDSITHGSNGSGSGATAESHP